MHAEVLTTPKFYGKDITSTMTDQTIYRLEEAMAQIEEVMKICGSPSISLGVINEGKVIFRKSLGYRDVDQRLEADSDSLYMMGSRSKMYTAAAVGKLVDEGKVSWTDPIQKYLPEFNPVGDPEIGQKADIIDAFRHSTGLENPTRLCVGPSQTLLKDDKDFIEVMNQMPTANDEGQRFNRHWAYNNGAVGLMAKVVERVSGVTFSDYVRENVLEPLGLRRTMLSRADIKNDDNIAYPHAQLSDGSFTMFESLDWPCDNNSPMLAALGIEASLNDVLSWCIAVMSAEREEQQLQSQAPNSSKATSSPLKQLGRIRKGYWTRPVDDDFKNEAAYCMGWIRIGLPSSMLGSFSYNHASRKEGNKWHLKNIIGTESAPRLAIGHTGGVTGALSNIWTFPETQSAVVALANGRTYGDASDFTNQILMQSLFNLKPRVDFVPWAKKEVELARQLIENDLIKPWKENRSKVDVASCKKNQHLYIGDYQLFDGKYVLSVVEKSEDPDANECNLALVYNHVSHLRNGLEFSDKHAFTTFTGSRDNSLRIGNPSARFDSTIVKFDVDETKSQVKGVWWHCLGEKPAWLPRVN